MANTRVSLNIQTQSSTDNEKDPLTVEGYLRIFESCESTFDAFKSLQSVNRELDVPFLQAYLNSKELAKLSAVIFQYAAKTRHNERPMPSDDYVKVIETLSLLENVLRNTLLQPHVPAYRTIDMNCSRYRCYIESKDEWLFENLGFRNIIDNLLTYTETDRLTTVICAVTCLCLWQWFRCALPNRLNPQNQGTQQIIDMKSTRV